MVQNALPDSPTAWRQVVYTCYQPREFAGEQDLAVKRQAWAVLATACCTCLARQHSRPGELLAAVQDFRVTTHWPTYQACLFPELESGAPLPLSVLHTVLRKDSRAQLGHGSDPALPARLLTCLHISTRVTDPSV